MTDSGSGDDPAASLEHAADELEHHLEELEDHIDGAQQAAEILREDLDPDVAAGDWEDTEGTPGQGQDPAGAEPSGRDD